MRARVLLWVCLGLNILLAAILVHFWQRPEPRPAVALAEVRAASDTNAPKTQLIVRRQGFTWSEIESADFPTYIKNLRNIGCPEHTIRDIILAEVNDLFAERLAKELNLPEQKWWLADPDMDALQAGMDQVRVLEAEKAQLLTQLLGPDWNTQQTAAASTAIRFDGPVLSALPAEARTNVERIEGNSRRLRNELQERARAEGRELTAEEVARLRTETRRELAAVLNPEQLEEYLLRYSATAEQMRDQLRGFGADADEFRRVFRARDAYEQQVAALGNDAASAVRREELARVRDEALRQALGPERFAFYQASQSPSFRQAQEQVEQRGAPPEKVLPIFRVNEAVQQETARIQADPSLSEDQRRIALVTVQQQQRNSIERILGNQAAEETAEVAAGTQASTANSSNIIMPPFPPLPGGVTVQQSLREGLPPGANLPPGVNQTTRGPTQPRLRR
jgi:hypothetical protein